MENILYITGGIALLSLAWLFFSLSNTLKTVHSVLTESRRDLHEITGDVREIKDKALPILDSASQLAIRANAIADGVQSQMVSIQETVDVTLDVVRGTIDDVERLKNDVVGIVEAPLHLARTTSNGAIGTVAKGVSLLAKIFAARKNGKKD